jgi:hypothetical protein
MFCLPGKPCEAWRLDGFNLLAAPRLGASRFSDALRDTAGEGRRGERPGVTSRRAETSAMEIESEDMSSESMATEPEGTRLIGGETVTEGCGFPALAASEDSLGRFSTRWTGA